MPPTANEKTKSVAELRARYEALQKQCVEARAAGLKLEKRLLEEVKLKVKKAAGDQDDLARQKREAFTAWERAVQAEKTGKTAPAKPPVASTPDPVPAVAPIES